MFVVLDQGRSCRWGIIVVEGALAAFDLFMSSKYL